MIADYAALEVIALILNLAEPREESYEGAQELCKELLDILAKRDSRYRAMLPVDSSCCLFMGEFVLETFAAILRAVPNDLSESWLCCSLAALIDKYLERMEEVASNDPHNKFLDAITEGGL